LLDVAIGEARFARAWLDEELRRLPRNAPILEIGGGVFLLACQLAREGFAVTAIEPVGAGFGSFEELGTIVLSVAAADGAQPLIVRCEAERFEGEAIFAFAFSVNVMEHVAAPDQAIARIAASLAPGRSYRFLCPNYLFPYEPHFNIPTFGSKSLTWRLMRSRIESTGKMDDPTGLWRSLNWITVPKVRRYARDAGPMQLRFRRSTLTWMLERGIDDEQFARRRARWMLHGIRAAKAIGVLRLASLIPAVFQPIMDACLTRRT
jgi:SAM-dependent methyltransferase